MGTNMQSGRALVRAEARSSQTGMEGVVARDSGARSRAAAWRGHQIDATRVVIRAPMITTRPSRRRYLPPDEVPALERPTSSTSARCEGGRRGAQGDIIRRLPSTDLGDSRSAATCWSRSAVERLQLRDSILLSERIVKDTSSPRSTSRNSR